MGFDAADIEKLSKLTALILQGITEVNNIIANKRAQEGRTEEENFDHAERRNKEARELIDKL